MKPTNLKVKLDTFFEVKEFSLKSINKTSYSYVISPNLNTDSIEKPRTYNNFNSLNRPVHKNKKILNIVPKSHHNPKIIERWCSKYKNDIDYIFNEIVSIFNKNEIDFSECDTVILEKFKRFLYIKNLDRIYPNDNTYQNLNFEFFSKDDSYNISNINQDFDEFFGREYSDQIYNLYYEMIKSVEILDTISPTKLENFFMFFVDRQNNLYYSESEDSSDNQFSDDDSYNI